MRNSIRVALAGMLVAALGASGLATASAASADPTHTIRFVQNGGFFADFCLTSQNYDNHSDAPYACATDANGGKDLGAGREIWWSIEHDPRRRIYLDLWVRGGHTGRQITIHNGFNERVGDHVFYPKVCEVSGKTFDWVLKCDGKEFYRTSS